jgi:integrase
MATIRRRSGGYNVQIRKQGYSTITKTFSSITTARKWAAGVEADMERHIHIEVSESITLISLLDRYQDEVIPLHKGCKSEQYRIQHLKKHLGHLRLIHLSPHEVSKYRDIRLETVSPASLKRELVILSRVLTIAAKDWGICIPKNPIPLVSLPKVDKERTRRLEKGEQEYLVDDSEMGRIITLALETAMRRGEMLNIKKSHINFSICTLLIPITKNDQPRTIPLSSVAITCLRSQLRASKRLSEGVIPLHEMPVFTYSARGVSGAFLKRCRRSGIEDLRFHDLRHEATSRLFEKGLNPVEVATITGHKDPRMLMRYTHLRAEDLAKKLG